MMKRILLISVLLLTSGSSLYSMEQLKVIPRMIPGIIALVGLADSLQSAFTNAQPKIKADLMAIRDASKSKTDRLIAVSKAIETGIIPIDKLVIFLKTLNDGVLQHAVQLAKKPEVYAKLQTSLVDAEQTVKDIKEAVATIQALASLIAEAPAAAPATETEPATDIE